MRRSASAGDITVRRCGDRDYRFCHDLTRRLMGPYFERHMSGFSPRKFRMRFWKDRIRIVEKRGRRIGYYMAGCYGDACRLHEIHLSGPHQGKGIGTMLLRRVEREARRRGMRRISLMVFSDNPSVRLYRRLGYKTIRSAWVNRIMEKEL